MKDLTSTSFGYLIAFLLPGIFGLFALSAWFEEVGAILQPVVTADATVGPSVVFLLIAIGMGLCVNAARFFVFEKLLCNKHHLPLDMFASLDTENKLTTFKSVVDEHYRYHQFYGGCAVAVVVLFGGWARHHLIFDKQFLWVSCGFVLVAVLLIGASVDAFVKYVKRGTIIVLGKSGDANSILAKESAK